MGKPRPSVSVMMPACNAEPFVREAVESVLRQDYKDFELIFLDDGSSDGTWKAVQKYRSDPRFRAFRQKHRGVGAARNRLARLARGKFLAPHDADDIMLQGRLGRHAGYLASHPKIGVVFSDHLCFDPTRKPPFLLRLVHREMQHNRFFIPITEHHGASMFRKSAFIRTGGYDERCRMGEDWDMWMKLYEVAKFRYLKGAVFIWRINPKGMTLTHGFIEDDHEHIMREAVRRRGRILPEISLAIDRVRVRFKTNSRAVLKLIQSSLYLGPRAGAAQKRFSCECYEVGHTDGIYAHVDYEKVDENTEFGRSADGERLFWRNSKEKFIIKVDRRAGKIMVFIANAAAFSGDALIDLVFTYPLIFLTRPMGWHFIHGAVLAEGEKGVLITGPSLSGKTTLSMAFVKKGMRLLSDETNILERANGVVRAIAFPRKVQIKKQAFKTFPELTRWRSRLFQTRSNPAKNKWMMPVEILRRSSRRRSAELKLVLFPRYRRLARPRFIRVHGDRLLRLLSGDKNYYVEFGLERKLLLDYVLLLRMIQRQAEVYIVEYSNDHWDELLSFVRARL